VGALLAAAAFVGWLIGREGRAPARVSDHYYEVLATRGQRGKHGEPKGTTKRLGKYPTRAAAEEEMRKREAAEAGDTYFINFRVVRRGAAPHKGGRP